MDEPLVDNKQRKESLFSRESIDMPAPPVLTILFF
jgi:hypothetical protein